MPRNKKNDQWDILQRAAALLNKGQHRVHSRTPPQRLMLNFPPAQPAPDERALVSPPEKVYKFMRREHAELLVGKGCTRVGTLYDFRKVENHARGVGDSEEGSKAISTIVTGRFDSGTPQTQALNMLRGVHIGEGCSNITFTDSHIYAQVNHQDALVWCCSTENTRGAMAEIGYADACVEIFDVQGFFSALDAVIRSRHANVETYGPFCVSYQDRLEGWNQVDLGLNPVFIKDRTRFEAQKEVRIAWFDPTQGEHVFQAELVEHSDCHKFCRIVDIE
ncbi:hypothetical protein L6Q82_29635 [Burkholderia cenocepacia]|uniref:hypothetical protein n=1 Tax=Burkholderia cenocepacia TaxID=95486 RepID=UPI001F2EA4F9|nr:hypothetical protein [Burkholderia cenocepacia]MCG0582139.1 hypothetical protein [Burkholderia cenocepacia]